ncbi:EAL domain-containing protein [Curvibacter sp. HBC61]|uniref:EAL domain-containing protein n=1 Tax=Curvibacter cyanobacteriorum TaxID=3026422 RepID=A0ABT5MUV6_9BURK|nr:EAL domain-containing protein [Curvibacter sp. HBC61]MDD0837824.1 EAL domain-containing protein [Curvibacter sp. HBC61]
MTDNGLVSFIDEADAPVADELSFEAQTPWRILVVDDDEDVHEATHFALSGLRIAGRALELLHARSAASCVEVLQRERDVAVVLLDVVMETPDAGLRLVEVIRKQLGLHQLRIILRTGQPGQSPELETINAYDINDYKTKNELTRTKLYASLTTALRSYDQLHRLELSRQGLEKIVDAGNQFIADQGMQAFAEGVITQIAGLLGIAPEGVVCASAEFGSGPADGENPDHFVIIAAAGPYREWMNRPLDQIADESIVASLRRSLQQRQTLVDRQSVTLFFAGKSEQDFAAHIAASVPLLEVDRRLLEVFCTNISLCANNVSLVNRLRDLAYNDNLLQLPNRFAFLKLLGERLEQGQLAHCVLAKLDIDQFAQANEMLGHRYGDLLLQALVARLNEHFAADCQIGRLGGNTFGLLGPERSLRPEALARICESPFQVGPLSRRLSASVGLVRCEDVMPCSAEDLIEYAFVALKQAKSQGQGRIAWFTRALGNDAKERSTLLQGLHKAFDLNRLFLVYQPKVDIQSEQVVGLEALVRWRDENGHMVPPDRFIPVAEQSGLIVALGLWVLRTALQTLAQLAQAGHGQIQMGVNVSVVQLEHPGFLAELKAILQASQLAPEQLELEVTESVAILGLDRVSALLESIRELGVGIAIDDFGTGFSSLSYIDRLPAHRLKIDRAFIENLDSEHRGARIARIIIPLGHQLGMKVVAEGVETREQIKVLQELGCDEVQGYFYARPMPYDELLTWLAKARAN